MNQYARFAEVYDRVGQSTPAEIMKDGYLGRLLERQGWQGSDILDLGCGTGTLAISLASAGYRVAAVDASEAMIDQARRKAGETAIAWGVQNARDLQLSTRFDLVIALNAVLSHLLEEADLVSAFRSVSRVLKPDGLFIFELPTEHAMANVWGYNRVCEVHEDMAWIWQHWWDPELRRSSTELTHFVRANDQSGLYERFSETHIHRAYAQEEIESLLTAAGLYLVDLVVFGTLDPPTPESTEIIYLARPASNLSS